MNVYVKKTSDSSANYCSTSYDTAFLAMSNEPKTYNDAINSVDSKQWIEAMDEEFDSLIKNNVWTLVNPPIEHNVTDNKWVFKVKENPDGSINRYKARFVVRGFE